MTMAVYMLRGWSKNQQTMVLIHGAGHTGHTWVAMINELQQICSQSFIPDILVVDLPGHGGSSDITCLDDWRAEVLCDRVNLCIVKSIHHFYGDQEAEPREITILGHSLGGSIVMKICGMPVEYKLVGCIVLDCAEGVALANLHHMQEFVENQREVFNSPEDCISWCLNEGRRQKSRTSATISIPPQLRETENGQWVWRVSLQDTVPYWENWFKGSSNSFIGSQIAFKVLVSAGGHDRLDTALVIGHMQGKFQLNFIPHSNHIIHEDHPEDVARILAQLFERQLHTRELLLKAKHGS
eukprot:GHVH01001928.1.p1 GENE.GHVH01001928.1~~GHVH01001928.1.p1  ORF type:complete len:297 (+),score=41.67 GHVH01001928.1:56-946(+)